MWDSDDCPQLVRRRHRRQAPAGLDQRQRQQVESERIEAEWAKAQLDAMLQVRLATSSFWEMRLITALIASCFTLHLILVTLDTCFSFGWRIPAFPRPYRQNRERSGRARSHHEGRAREYR
jgi:hypothetical protein